MKNTWLLIPFILLSLSSCVIVPPASQDGRFRIQDGYTPSLSEQINRVGGQSIATRVLKYGNLKDAAKEETWHWGSGVFMFGLVRAHSCTGTKDFVTYPKLWVEFHQKNGIHLTHTDRVMPAGVVGDMLERGYVSDEYAPILDQAYDYLMEGQRRVKGCGGEWKDLEWRGRTWLDDLVMTGVLMIRYREYYQKPGMDEMIASQFLAHIDLLQCHQETKLMNHGQWLGPKGRRWFPSGKVAWARANGWFLVAMGDFLEHSSPEKGYYAVLQGHFQDILSAVSACQKEDGLFPTVLDKPRTKGEVAATALFVQATATGLKNGWIEGEAYFRLVRKGLEAIYQNIDETGRIRNISAGTPVMPTPGLYNRINMGTYPWGEGAVLLAFCAVKDLLEKLQGEELVPRSEKTLLLETYQ